LVTAPLVQLAVAVVRVPVRVRVQVQVQVQVQVRDLEPVGPPALVEAELLPRAWARVLRRVLALALVRAQAQGQARVPVRIPLQVAKVFSVRQRNLLPAAAQHWAQAGERGPECAGHRMPIAP
jgi:hypothetical protein